jgi:hypothetical protein
MRGGAGVPHEGDFFGGEAVGLRGEVGELAFQRKGFGGLGGLVRSCGRVHRGGF